MKLLFYIKSFRELGAGLENQAVWLCQALAERGHDVHVLTNDGDDVPGVTVHREGLDFAVTLCGRLLPDLCIDWGFLYPADIHRLGAGTHEGYIKFNLDSLSGVRRLWRLMRYNSAKHRRIKARELTMLQNPEAQILANSNQTAKMAIETGADEHRVTAHHNGVNMNSFHPRKMPEFRDEYRERLGLAHDDVAFIFVAHNLRLKNIALLRRVFSKLDPMLNAKLIVVGKRRPRFTAPWLIYAGKAERMDGYYAAADALVHPTWFDSCANVVLEAMACGRPVVVSDSCGIHEIVRHGQDGSVLSVRGSKSTVDRNWREAIRLLAKDPDLRRRQGMSAHETATHHNLDSYLNWFDDYLKEVRAKKVEREGLVFPA